MSLQRVPAPRVQREDTGSMNCWNSRLKNAEKGGKNSRGMLRHAPSLSGESFSLNLSLRVKIMGISLEGAGRIAESFSINVLRKESSSAYAAAISVARTP